MLHDEGIAITWPGIEPVPRYDCLDLNMLESAVARPFGSGFGIEYYPTLYDKAACLFHAFIADHIFVSGNKRTAVLVLDQFLLANGEYLVLQNEEIKQLARDTVPEAYRARGENHKSVVEKLSDLIGENSIPFTILKPHLAADRYEAIIVAQKAILTSPLNAASACPNQREERIPFGLRIH
jgi:death-on-curing family protein